MAGKAIIPTLLQSTLKSLMQNQCRMSSSTPRLLAINKKHEGRIQKAKHKQWMMESKKNKPPVFFHKEMTIGEICDSTKRTVEQVNEAISILNKSQEKRMWQARDTIHDNKVLTSLISFLGYRPKPAIVEKVENKPDKDVHAQPVTEDMSKLKPRPPIVALMGHVDHGKTTILDRLRKSSVAASEAGGITQSIGAFSVPLPTGETVTFIDTPGHAIFSAMRERGAKATDIIVLVVAADDGVMDQTIESIKMARMAESGIVVAINKCDKKEAQPDVVIEELQSYGVMCTEVGGTVPAVRVSGLHNKGLDELVQCISMEAELLNLRADPQMQFQGSVIESKKEKGRGAMASLIVRQGTLNPGKILLAGTSVARVKLLLDSNGQRLGSAGPGTPVNVVGWKSLPAAGQLALGVETEAKAKQALLYRERELKFLHSEEIAEEIEEKRKIEREEYEMIRSELVIKRNKVARSHTLHREKARIVDNHPELRIIVKVDVDGSAEAILKILNSYDCDSQCRLKLLYQGVGDLTVTDIELARTSNASIFLFNCQYDAKSKEVNTEDLSIYSHNVIYHFVHALKEKIESCLPPVAIHEVDGVCTVSKTFKQRGAKSTVAGCVVVRGEMDISSECRVIRNGEIVYSGNLASLRQFDKSVKLVAKGMECGIILEDNGTNFNVEIGDNIQCFTTNWQKDKLQWRPPGF